jgi:hypothetical protein
MNYSLFRSRGSEPDVHKVHCILRQIQIETAYEMRTVLLYKFIYSRTKYSKFKGEKSLCGIV